MPCSQLSPSLHARRGVASRLNLESFSDDGVSLLRHRESIFRFARCSAASTPGGRTDALEIRKTATSGDPAIPDTALVSAKTAALEVITPMPSAVQVKATLESEGLTFVEVASFATTGGWLPGPTKRWPAFCFERSRRPPRTHRTPTGSFLSCAHRCLMSFASTFPLAARIPCAPYKKRKQTRDLSRSKAGPPPGGSFRCSRNCGRGRIPTGRGHPTVEHRVHRELFIHLHAGSSRRRDRLRLRRVEDSRRNLCVVRRRHGCRGRTQRSARGSDQHPDR